MDYISDIINENIYLKYIIIIRYMSEIRINPCNSWTNLWTLNNAI